MSMYYEVRSVCEKFRQTWITNVVFAAVYNEWTAFIPLIEKNRDAQLATTKGPTSEKTDLWEVLIDKALFVINRIQSYANTSHNLELSESVKFTATDLRHARDSKLVGMCNMVVAKARIHQVALADYGVSEAVLDDLASAIDDYSKAMIKPETVRSEIKTATENLVVLMRASDELLSSRMDLDIEVFKLTAHDFYSQYQTARMGTSKGSHTTMLIAHVTDAEDGSPLKGVTITLTLLADSSVTLTKKSAEHGNLYVPSLVEGKYQMKVEKTDFESQLLPVTVVKGESVGVSVALKRL